MADKKGKTLERLKEQLKKLELQETDRDENKTIALGTSKLNYLDPRITVAWWVECNVTLRYFIQITYNIVYNFINSIYIYLLTGAKSMECQLKKSSIKLKEINSCGLYIWLMKIIASKYKVTHYTLAVANRIEFGCKYDV